MSKPFHKYSINFIHQQMQIIEYETDYCDGNMQRTANIKIGPLVSLLLIISPHIRYYIVDYLYWLVVFRFMVIFSIISVLTSKIIPTNNISTCWFIDYIKPEESIHPLKSNFLQYPLFPYEFCIVSCQHRKVDCIITFGKIKENHSMFSYEKTYIYCRP